MEDLFGPKPRAPRRVMMKAIDTGDAGYLEPGWRTSTGGHFVCRKCGHDAGWIFNLTPSEVWAGQPCPVCNGPPQG